MENIFEMELVYELSRLRMYDVCIRFDGYDRQGVRMPTFTMYTMLRTMLLRFPSCHHAELSIHIHPRLPPKRKAVFPCLPASLLLRCNDERIGCEILSVNYREGIQVGPVPLARPGEVVQR